MFDSATSKSPRTSCAQNSARLVLRSHRRRPADLSRSLVEGLHRHTHIRLSGMLSLEPGRELLALTLDDARAPSDLSVRVAHLIAPTPLVGAGTGNRST